jgi:DNA-binding SARP family transcriptional activator
MLQIHTFGGLRLMLDGKPVTGFISRKVEALLVYLACNPREHPREVLAELLWDDLTQERTMANLRQTLSDLQKQLAPYLIVTRQSVSINPESDIWLDSAQLGMALNAMERAAKGDLNRTLVAQLDEGLALYQGDFLQGFNIKAARGFEGWRLLETERMRGRVMDALLRLAAYHLKRHAYPEGIACASQLVRLDPLSEEAHRVLMTLYAMSGQRGAALSQYETCRKIMAEELDLEPEDETTELFEQIRENELTAAPAAETPNNLLLPSTPFIPRPELQLHIQTALAQPESRLVTLVGAAGSGKTRLALAMAAEQLPHFPDGVFFVTFTSVQGSDQIARTICNTLQIDQQGGTPPERLLTRYLSSREVLLVLDNLEHLLDGVGLFSELLSSAPGVKILATSIERLNLLEEWVIPVSGMSVPDEDTLQTEDFAAVQMFIQSARRVHPEFSAEKHLEAIARICRFLNGNPLAIELAAAWVRMMSCGEILTEMQRSIDFLTTSLRNLPERHRSMRGVFEALWRLLTPEEKILMAELSIFRGGFTHEAAREVTGASPAELSRLVDKSILTPSSGRYDIHPLLAKFLGEKLRYETSEFGPISDRHSRYYASFLASREAFLSRTTRNEEVNAIARDMDNILQGMRLALLKGDEALVGQYILPLYHLYNTLNRYYEAADIFREIAQMLDAEPGKPLSLIQAQALVRWGAFTHFVNRYQDAQPLLLGSLESLRAHRDIDGLRLAVKSLAVLSYAQGDYAASRGYYKELLQIAHEVNNPLWMGNALFGLGNIALVEGDAASARQYLREAHAALELDGSIHERISLLTTLGDLECKLGFFDEAAALFEEALYLSVETRSLIMQGVALVSMGRVAYGQERYEESKDFCRRSIERCEETRNTWGKAFALTHLARAYYRMGDYTGARYHIRKALELCDQIGNRWVKSFALRQAGRSYITLDAPELYLYEALRLALEIGAAPLMLDTISGIASLALERGDAGQAAQLAWYVRQHPASEYEALMEARGVMEQVAPEWVETAQAAMNALSVEQVARAILANTETVQ